MFAFHQYTSFLCATQTFSIHILQEIQRVSEFWEKEKLPHSELLLSGKLTVCNIVTTLAKNMSVLTWRDEVLHGDSDVHEVRKKSMNKKHGKACGK